MPDLFREPREPRLQANAHEHARGDGKRQHPARSELGGSRPALASEMPQPILKRTLPIRCPRLGAWRSIETTLAGEASARSP